MAAAGPWYLVHTKPRQEAVALQNLLNQGYLAWLPTLKALPGPRQKPGPDGFCYPPLFPRYLFCQPSDAKQSIAPVQSTLGVSRLVRFGSTPAALGDAAFAELQAWVAHQHQQAAVGILQLQPGHIARVAQGPFAGLDVLVTLAADQRVIVLLELMGKQHALALPVKAFSPA